jgi:hypothetical protein
MKQASQFEKVAARCWNVLNEGKPFTPVFVIGTFLLFHWHAWADPVFWISLFYSLLLASPLFVLYFTYDFPLTLRKFLWLPLLVSLVLFTPSALELLLGTIGLYIFFTVFFWGTIYYHLRIGTTLWNFTRFWKLVLKNSDSTSGNSQEQVPKVLTLLTLVSYSQQQFFLGNTPNYLTLALFFSLVGIGSWLLHRLLFTWRPEEWPDMVAPADLGEAKADRVIIIVIDGCRKDRLAQAHTPFLDELINTGTTFDSMETIYPARTVVCFSTMFTGAYPREHGIKSNMVYKHGVRTESIFDSLRKVGKCGRLLGVAHLVDAFGEDVDAYTAVAKNDVVDKLIIGQAKALMKERDPDLLIVQLIGTDQTGHSRGALYDEYVQKIEEADTLIKDFYEWLNEQGYLHNTAILICADHGQSDGIGGHGHLDEGERFVPFIMHGPMIRGGHQVTQKHSLVSVAGTIAYLLGVPIPAQAKGQVFTEAMKKAGEINEKDQMYHRHTSA